jgi:4-amino-4-deoxychorismate lyase
MVKFHQHSFTYDYSFPAVSLAYFLRYPNPYSTHVLSTDVIDRSIDPETGRLKTTRLHLKRSRLPPAVLKLLPKSVMGNISGGSSSSYILETSTVDIKEGWMETESRNLDWTGILSVVERQVYRPSGDAGLPAESAGLEGGTTAVTTSIKFRSRLGDKLNDRLRARAEAKRIEADEEFHRNGGEEEEPKKGFLATWSTAGIQRTIEAIASQKTINSQGKSKQGMNIVLERLRHGGLMGVLEGMRRDREGIVGGQGAFKSRDQRE